MPLSEFYRMAEGKIEATQPKTMDISYVPANEFVELVWENGQVMMQGQTSRARKTPVSSNFQFHTPKFQDREIGDADTSKMGKFGAMGSSLNVPIPVPSVDIGLNQDDDMAPWLNYPIDDSLEQHFCSNFLPEISGVTVNDPSNNNTFGLTDKRGSCNPTVRDSNSVSVHHGSIGDQVNTSKPSSLKANHIFPWTLNQGQTLAPSRGSGVSDIMSCNTRNSPSVICGDLAQGQSSSAPQLPRLRLPNQDSGLPCSSSNLLNFSHFSRPVAMARANSQNCGAQADCSSSAIERMGNNDKPLVPNNNVPAEVKLDGPSCVFQKEMGFHGQSSLVQLNGDSKPLVSKPLEESCSGGQSDTCRREAAITDKSPNLALGTMAAKGAPDSDKKIEPIVTTSSVCSGNSAERASNDLTKNVKRKRRDTEEFECQSEDVEEEWVGGKKAGFSRGGTGSKRSRAAEVHNLSERRRRDRINEKMRALQELIPNCNKVDKASMLDEAIEYLKTLQLQVQIMSMGAGLCMPPMMFSAGMQHMHAAHVPHYSHMGVGMGMRMGIGFGMGMLDMNGGSHGRPVMAVPPMQGQRYPSPPIPSLSSFQGVPPGSNFQMFGHPGQGIPMPFPQGSMAPMPVRPPLNPAAEGSSASRVGPGPHVEGPNIASDLISKDLIQNASTQQLHNADTNKSMNQTPNQLREKNEGFKNDQAADVGGSAAVLTNSSDTTLSRGTGSD